MNYNNHKRIQLEQGKNRKFAQVFKLINQHNVPTYLLKQISKNNASKRIIEVLRNEQLFSFDHPNLPKVIDYIEEQQQHALILSYKNGVNLEHFWKQIPSKEKLNFLKKLMSKIVKLLDFIHSTSIFHCDLKPSNILIDGTLDDFEVHLIDFGLAIHQNRIETYNRKTLFPLGYAAPELILNKLKLVDASTDYFSLGILVYRLWANKLPLSHPNPSIYTNLQLAHPIPESKQIPRELHQWIVKACVKPQFRTAPNLLHQEEVENELIHAMKKRFKNSEELLESFNQIELNKRFFWF